MNELMDGWMDGRINGWMSVLPRGVATNVILTPDWSYVRRKKRGWRKGGRGGGGGEGGCL